MTENASPVSQTKAPPEYCADKWTITRINGEAHVEQGEQTQLIYTTRDTGQTDTELMGEASTLYRLWLD